MTEASRRTPWYLVLLRPAVGLPLALVLLGLSAPFAYRNYQLHRVPEIGEPFDIERYRYVELAQEENACELYSRAVALVTPMDETIWKQLQAANKEGWTAAGPECRAWLEKNRAALGQFVLATERRDVLFIQPGELFAATEIPVISGLPPLVWSAGLEAARLEHVGDPAAAYGYLRAMLRASRHCGQHGSLMERILGISFHLAAVEGLNRWAQRRAVGPDQLRAALAESRAIFATTALPSSTIRVEYLMNRRTLENPAERIPDFSGSSRDDWRMPYFEGEPELSRRLIRWVYANWLTQCDLPRSQRASVALYLFDLPITAATTGADQLSVAALSDLLRRSLYARRVVPSARHFLDMHESEQALQLLLETALQLQIHFRRQGSFPESLDELAGSFGEPAPIDPFGRGRPLRYRLSQDTAEGVTLWSLGPDEIDDAGQPKDVLYSPSGNGDIVVRVRPPVNAD